MTLRILMRLVGAAALIAGTGFVQAQTPAASGAAATGASRGAPPAVASPSPPIDPAAPAERTPPVNRDEATDTTNDVTAPNKDAGLKSTPSDDKVERDNGDVRATDVTGDNKNLAGRPPAGNKTGTAR